MRVVLALLILILPVAADPGLAGKFPAGATAYVELSGAGGRVEALLDSPLGASVRQHPVLQLALASPQGKELTEGLAKVEQITGFGRAELLKAVFGERFALAAYGGKQRVVAVSRMKAQVAERLVAGVEQMFGVTRREVLPAEEDRPALHALFTIHFFHDGEHFVVTSDALLATAIRNDAAGKGLAADPRVAEARERAGDAMLFGFVDLKQFAAQLGKYDKPKNMGEAMILGAFAHYVPKAPWAAFRVDLTQNGEAWQLSGEGYLPTPATKEEDVVSTSYRGTLKPLPFSLPERTVGVIRMRRSLRSIWSNRDALIAPKGIPGLIEFETNFGNLAGGLSWVEEVLPNFGDELIVIGTRRIFAEGKPAPAVKFPQGALLVPLKNSEEMGAKLQIAFNNLIAILNIQQGMTGYNLLTVASDYKGVRILQGTYMAATKGEMEGKKSLPPRFNLAPACATVGGHFVIASHGDIIKEIIDNYGKPESAPAGVNAGLWVEPAQVRVLLAENREPLIAKTMLDEGVSRAEAEQRIGLLLELSRYIRSFEVTSRETRSTVGLSFAIGLEAPKG